MSTKILLFNQAKPKSLLIALSPATKSTKEEGRRRQKKAEKGRRRQKKAEGGRRRQKKAEEGRRRQKKAEEGILKTTNCGRAQVARTEPNEKP